MNLTSVYMRDGTLLPVYKTLAPADPHHAVVMLHGITTDMDTLAASAEQAADKLNTTVYLPVLRGYHHNKRKATIVRTSQFDEDIEDLLRHFQSRHSFVTLAGHSMGAGNVLRYLQEKGTAEVSASFLAAPFLHPAHPVFHSFESDNKAYTISLKKAVAAGFLTRMGLSSAGHWKIAEIPIRTHPLDSRSATYRKQLSFRLLTSRFITRPTDFQGISTENMHILCGKNDEVVDFSKLDSFLKEYRFPEVTSAGAEDHMSVLTSRAFLESMEQALQKAEAGHSIHQ
ncbi:alpha/beta hydrolase [Alkalicoccus urumqiensis]|uniref:Serine aminopeptidase S33 domain-containing protein n=1 Tax=Alkalicoccus urumqiensis TaxID=1548213 RepID=A0A2P6MGP1_ALKUR|nr:alpha/beta fold hydrolase [Alkalicoccus urumqiensis]PRO65441.1 hypothetical protein C6I21_09795 [Alkalicoccus urumqiensis]